MESPMDLMKRSADLSKTMTKEAARKLDEAIMTPGEQRASKAIEELLAGFKDMQSEAIEAGFQSNSGDWGEVVAHIHCLQNWIGANLAVRISLGTYRPFGATFPEKV